MLPITAPPKNVHEAGGMEKTAKKAGVTLRFDLELTSPSDNSTNEFSYEQLEKDRISAKVPMVFAGGGRSFE